MILLHDTKLNNNHTKKILYKWFEFYIIKNATKKNIYILMKLNEIKFTDIYSENRLKQFHSKQQLKITTNDENNFSNQKTIANNEKTDSNDFFQNLFSETLQTAISSNQTFAIVIFNRNHFRMETIEIN